MSEIKLNQSEVLSTIISNKEKRKSFKKIAEQRLGETRLNNMGSKC